MSKEANTFRSILPLPPFLKNLRSWLSLVRASVWTCRREQSAGCVLQSVSGGWCSVLNGALIRLIHGALVYKQAPHNRHSLIARRPRRVVPSMSVLFLKAGKQRCREGRRGKQPQGSCESASEHSTSRRSAKILFQLSH